MWLSPMLRRRVVQSRCPVLLLGCPGGGGDCECCVAPQSPFTTEVIGGRVEVKLRVRAQHKRAVLISVCSRLRMGRGSAAPCSLGDASSQCWPVANPTC